MSIANPRPPSYHFAPLALRPKKSAESDKFAWLTPPPVAVAVSGGGQMNGGRAAAGEGVGGSGAGEAAATLQPRALQLIIGKVCMGE